MKAHLLSLAAWIVARQTRHRARTVTRRLDELSAHLRRDAGLPARNPRPRATGRGRFGLPT